MFRVNVIDIGIHPRFQNKRLIQLDLPFIKINCGDAPVGWRWYLKAHVYTVTSENWTFFDSSSQSLHLQMCFLLSCRNHQNLIKFELQQRQTRYHCKTQYEVPILHMKNINFMVKLPIYNFNFKYLSPSGRNLYPLVTKLSTGNF